MAINGTIGFVTEDDVRASGNSKSIRRIGVDKILRMPRLFGLHGTTATNAREIFESKKLDPEALRKNVGAPSRLKHAADAFYFFAVSPQLFHFSSDWTDRVSIRECREHLAGSISSAVFYSLLALETVVENAYHESGLGVLIFPLEIDYRKFSRRDTEYDLDESLVARKIPLKFFDRLDMSCVAAVTTDEQLSRNTQLSPDMREIVKHSGLFYTIADAMFSKILNALIET
jgi:hypothetical protein